MNLSGAAILDPEAGRALSAEHARIAEIIQDYDPELELGWIPPEQRAGESHPFCVIHRPAGRQPYIVFKLRENEVDHRVLTRLFNGDNAKQNVLGSIESDDAALQVLNLKRQMDASEEAKEMSKWAIKARAGATLNGVRLE